MAKFLVQELVPIKGAITVRLGAGTGSSNQLTDAEVGKFYKLGGDSRYVACVAGDAIEGRIESVNYPTQDDYSIGAIRELDHYFSVTADGLQATPGTGTIAVGDYVVVGTVVAKGTAIATGEFARVTKATVQPGDVLGSLTIGGTQDKSLLFPSRVISLGPVGTGAVGTQIVIQRAK